MMVVGVYARKKPWGARAFWIGWGGAFGIAVYASISQMLLGDVCPIPGPGFPLYEMPLCYVSLALCAIIAGSYHSLRRSTRVATV